VALCAASLFHHILTVICLLLLWLGKATVVILLLSAGCRLLRVTLSGVIILLDSRGSCVVGVAHVVLLVWFFHIKSVMLVVSVCLTVCLVLSSCKSCIIEGLEALLLLRILLLKTGRYLLLGTFIGCLRTVWIVVNDVYLVPHNYSWLRLGLSCGLFHLTTVVIWNYLLVLGRSRLRTWDGVWASGGGLRKKLGLLSSDPDYLWWIWTLVLREELARWFFGFVMASTSVEHNLLLLEGEGVLAVASTAVLVWIWLA